MGLDYATMQNEWLYRFTPQYAYDYQDKQIAGILDFTRAVNFLEAKRNRDIDYLSNQISIAQNTPAPISPPVNDVGMLSRTVADFVNGLRGVTRLGRQSNVDQYARLQVYNQNTTIYREAVKSWSEIISGYVNNLTQKRSLLESRSFV